ncbi:MAG TPA: S8 family serine peptidase [Bryobacteraceae bacterium]|nr:S8 family serine peptidase [Bryobacteraceae bacterium]
MRRFALILSLALAASVSGQIVPGRYIVELTDEPAVMKGRRNAASDRLAAIRSSQSRVRAALADRGMVAEPVSELLVSTLAVEASPQEAAALAAVPGVAGVYPVQKYRKLLDRAIVLQKVTEAWTLAGGVENAGRGIKIGIIDTGIDSSHTAFQDPGLSMPEGYPKTRNADDSTNVNSKVIVSRRYVRDGSSRDTDGHGTGIAMIAAGRTVSSPRGTITGVAPKAWLGSYKVFADGADGASTDAVLRALDDAVADGMDVVNLSLGSFPVSDPSKDILARAVERASEAGLIVVVASGNSGPDAATVGSPGTAPSAITVGNAWNDRVFVSNVRIGEAILLASPSNRSESQRALSGRLANVESFDSTGLLCAPAPSGSLTGRVAFILRGDCYFEEKLRNAQAGGAIAAVIYTHADEPSPGTWSAGEAELPGIMIGYQDGLAVRSVLNAGRNLEATLNFVSSPVDVTSARLSSSSSRGPSHAGAVKPEILGVGTSVLSAGPVKNGENLYQVTSGTSFSAPMVAGAAAVLKALRPGLRADQYRSLLIGSSSTFTYSQQTAPAPVQQTGAGLLNVAAAVRSTVTAFPHALNFGVGSSDPYQTLDLTIENLANTEDTYSVEVQPIGGGPAPAVSASSLSSPAGGVSKLRVTLQAAGLPPGEYHGFLVVRSSTNSTQASVPYWYAVSSGTVDRLTVGEYDDSGRRESLQEFTIRPSDAAGLSVDSRPEVVVTEGGGSVVSVQRSSFYPGFWTVEVRLGPAAGANAFEVRAGGRTKSVRFTGE